MSDKRFVSSSQLARGTGGACIDVGALERNSITGRAGAMVMRTVSIFLTSGRRVSVNNPKRQQSPSIAAQNSSSTRERRRRGMSDEASTKNSSHQAKIIDSLRRKTRFTRIELEALCKIYRRLTTIPGQRGGSNFNGKMSNQSSQTVESTLDGSKTHVIDQNRLDGSEVMRQLVMGIDRTIFRELLHNTFDVITEDTLIERMFCCWDRESEGSIRLDSWILGLDVFLRGNIHDRMEFCFRVYDLNNDGYITKDEMFQLFKNCLIKQPGEEDPDEGVRDLSELALKKLDVDHDGKVSFQDYESAIKNEPLLLEAFGQCLPTEESCQAFIMTLQP